MTWPERTRHASCSVQVRNITGDLYFWEVAGENWAINPKPGLQNPLLEQVGVGCYALRPVAVCCKHRRQISSAVYCSRRRGEWAAAPPPQNGPHRQPQLPAVAMPLASGMFPAGPWPWYPSQAPRPSHLPHALLPHR